MPDGNGAGGFDPFSNVFAPDHPPAFLSPPTLFFGPGGSVNIPYPALAPGGGAVPNLTWVLIANAGPYPLVVATSRVLGRILPYTTDKLRITGGATGGLTVTPDRITSAAGGSPIAGTSGSGYCTVEWYTDEPDGIYPAAFGSAFAPNGILSQTFLTPNAANFVLGSAQLGLGVNAPWATGIAVRVLNTPNGGAATGLRIRVSVQGVQAAETMYPVGASPWWTVPILNGEFVSQVVVDGLLNKTPGVGATFGGILQVVMLTGPVVPGLMSTSAGPLLGLTTGDALVGAGATAVVAPAPPTGWMYRIRHVSVFYAAAPAAAAPLQLQGDLSALVYWRGMSPAAVGMSPQSGQVDFLTGTSLLADPAEGLQFVNGASTAALVVLALDQLAYPQQSGTFYS